MIHRFYHAESDCHFLMLDEDIPLLLNDPDGCLSTQSKDYVIINENITDFRSEFRWLSNFYVCDIWYEGLCFPSTEHAYQAAKTLSLAKRVEFTQTTMTCNAAKHHGGQLLLRPDWDKVKFGVMDTVVRYKFTAHAHLAQMLLQTTGQLVEGNHWGDQYWGVCNGVGENNLGKILMNTREDLRALALLGKDMV